MASLLVPLGSVVAGSTFVAVDLALGARGGRSATATGRRDVVAEAAVALMRLPPLARVARSAQAVRIRGSCLRQMPVMLDVVTLGLTAGLSFDSSLELYCQRYHDPLSIALREAMLTWRLGTATREEALTAMARELGVSALERFAGVVSQALAFGSPLAATLEQQATAIREEQRAQVEEEIERVPVKMLIPLGTLIVPAMLLAILGPLLGASLTMG